MRVRLDPVVGSEQGGERPALVEPPEGGLTLRSKVLLMQLRSIDKRRLAGSLGRVGRETMTRVDEALRIAVGLGMA